MPNPPPVLPATMQAAVLHAYTGPSGVRVEERPVPVPRPGQVLVRIMASPINPSDLLFLEGRYGFTKPTPVVPGFEAAGVVVAAADPLGRRRIGQRVVCAVQERGDGPWAEYMLAPAAFVLGLPRHLSFEQGSMALVNPLTAIALIEMARRGRHRAVVQTAAASALGRMIARLAAEHGISVIHVVRRTEQADGLRAEGAQHILDSSDPGFDAALGALCRSLDARLAFDAVAGPMTARVLGAMPRGGRVVVYGALSLEAAQASPIDLIFHSKRVEGFWLSDWLGSKNPIALLNTSRRAFAMLDGVLKTAVQARYPVAQVGEALTAYAANMSAGKVLITPHGAAESAKTG
jgi:NADPH:quinone reductase-like Zn-dependent oxidoreductase